MSGIPFRVDGKGRVLISWMSRNKVYWSFSAAGASRFAPRIGTPTGGKDRQSYPVAIANHKGQVLLVWKEGKDVKWAVYTTDGKPAAQRGKAGELPGPDKVTAFAGSDDLFYVVF